MIIDILVIAMFVYAGYVAIQQFSNERARKTAIKERQIKTQNNSQSAAIRKAQWSEICKAIDLIYSACERNLENGGWYFDIHITTGTWGYVTIEGGQIAESMIPSNMRDRMEYDKNSNKILYSYPTNLVAKGYGNNRTEETREQQELAQMIYQYLKSHHNDYLTNRLHMDSLWSMVTNE